MYIFTNSRSSLSWSGKSRFIEQSRAEPIGQIEQQPNHRGREDTQKNPDHEQAHLAIPHHARIVRK
jgi:hypothetical protein